MAEKFLGKIYDKNSNSAREIYAEWSESYDAEITLNGYATPERCANALVRFAADLSLPVLDYGCGTGLSGVALRSAGFSHIDGYDISREMIELARPKNIYDTLVHFEPKVGPPVSKGQYSMIAAVGAISIGAAPLQVFDTIFDLLPKAGLFVFSFNDRALANPAYGTKVKCYIESEKAELLLCEYGDHLPGIGLKSNVYVLKKL